MVKAVLYLFAVMGLLIAPLHAQAAERDCEGMTVSMAMSGDSMDCCDHDKSSKSSGNKSSDKSCFNACIAMGGLSVAFDAKPMASQLVRTAAKASFAELTTSLVAEEPRLLIPPPKSNA